MPVDHEEALEAQHLNDAEDIYRTLRALQLQRSLLTVTLAGSKNIGSSLVLETELDSHTLYIDQLSDSALQAQLAPGQTLLLRASYGGVQVSGLFSIMAISRDSDAIQLAFPSELMHRQRRAAFRVNLTAPLTTIQLKGKDRAEPLEGVIVDISADGLAVEFDRFVRPPIMPSEYFQHCHFSYNDEEWELGLIAKHPSFDKQTSKYRCGFSFRSLSSSQSKSINQWILQTQRYKQKRSALYPRPKS
ncbi:flagellar brake protein [Simiduia curdlanivorans]|uniref:Flagellar brake protein n=1 Tax=Simiduia curdlanivorans TaxID=1492769 RepID=A0ABV8V1Y8_9GAMM|nr:flagellar brake protein [Simiduia curdlanivorans]MDN3639969.1 flagellar brake protein [Simiduia curdlanivorans]